MSRIESISPIPGRMAMALVAVAAVAVVGVCLSANAERDPGAGRGSRADSLTSAQAVKEAWELAKRARIMIAERGEAQSPGALPTFNRARDTLGRAGVELAAEHYAEALDLAERARETLGVAAQLASIEITAELIEQKLSGLDELRREAQNLASECPAPGIRDLMGRGDDRVRLAREHAEARRLDYAEAEATIARELYTQVMQICTR